VEKILQSDKSLFPSMREILESWRIVDPMLHDTQDIEIYPAQTLPNFAKEMMKKDNLTWFA